MTMTTWERMEEFVDERMRTLGIPGAAVGVWHQGETVSAGFGVTNAEHPLPVNVETLFQIGSITKTFTGTMLMMLAEQGKLSIDAPIRDVLPEFRVADETASSQATVRHLLTHTGGWDGDVFEDTGSGSDALAAYVERMAGRTQIAPVGAAMSYNNAGFAVAGRILEALTGKSYAELLHERLLEPLGLSGSTLDAGDVMLRRYAVGHHASPQGSRPAGPWPLPRYVEPMGGLICPIGDLLTYARFHLGDGTAGDGQRLLRPETLASMHVPVMPVWRSEAWGMPFAVDDTSGVRVVSHGGGTVGQVSMLAFVPEHDFAVAILTNADQGRRMTREAMHWALREFLGVSVEQPAPQTDAEADLAPFVGQYSRPFQDLELGLLGGRLIAQATFNRGFPTQSSPVPPPPPPETLVLCAPDRLLVVDGPSAGQTVDVVRRDDGAIGWLRAGLRLHRRVS